MDIEHCFTVRLDRIYQIRVAADKALTQRLFNMSVARLPPIRASERTTVQKYKKNQIANRQFRTIYLYRHKKSRDAVDRVSTMFYRKPERIIIPLRGIRQRYRPRYSTMISMAWNWHLPALMSSNSLRALCKPWAIRCLPTISCNTQTPCVRLVLRETKLAVPISGRNRCCVRG